MQELPYQRVCSMPIRSQAITRRPWLTQVIDGPNKYQFEVSDPVDSLDPTGTKHGCLHNFSGAFTDEDVKKIEASLERVGLRSITLLKEIDAEMATEGSGKCFDKLKQLRKVIESIKLNLDPDYHDFLGYGGSITFTALNGSDYGHSSDAVLWWEWDLTTIQIYFNKQALTPWNQLKDSELDQRLFHELTHNFGTDDSESKDDFNNAHLIEYLMNEPLTQWIVLKSCKGSGSPSESGGGSPPSGSKK
jgi:hypothetical protein